jgi:NADH-quinone oxidoreductase subunit A
MTLNIFSIVSIGIGILLLLLKEYLYMSELKINNEKVSVYECGFESLGTGRNKFEIQYYCICILFIIFDLEVILVLPYSINIYNVSYFGY